MREADGMTVIESQIEMFMGKYADYTLSQLKVTDVT